MSAANERPCGHSLFPGGGERPRILMVAEDPVIGCILAGALNRSGFDVEIFKNASLVLASLNELEPDLAVVDGVMSDVDGLSLIDQLKAKKPDISTILINSGVEREAAELALRSGRVDMVLNRPFNLASFINTVSSCVNNRNLPSAAEAPTLEEHAAWPGPLAGWLALDGRDAYFEHILDSLIDAVMMIDREGRIIYHNNGARRMFCFRNQAGQGLSLTDICPPDNPLINLFPLFFSHHPPVQEQSEGYLIKVGGTRFYTIFSASLFQAGSCGSAMILVVKDINAMHVLFEKTTAETRKLEKLALTDPLTGLFNRRYFDQRLTEEFRRVERYNSTLTMIMIDFDHFKKINDRFGHLVGDQVLRRSAEVLGHTLRDIDILSRWGGEEYMVLLPETDGETGQAVAKRLHNLVGSQEQWRSLTPGFKVTVSMGLVSLPWAAGRSPTITDVLENIDRALYRAKKNGRNRIVRYVDDQDSFVEV